MLKNSSFKKLLLNPGLSYNVDEDGNDPNGDSSQIVEALPGHEGVSGLSNSGVSKLRARNAQQLADTDERYQGKTVKRAELEDDEHLNDDYDPSLAKYFLIEEEEEEVDNDNHQVENDHDDGNVSEDVNDDETDEEMEEEGEEDNEEEISTNGIKSSELPVDFEMFADDDFEDSDGDNDSEDDDNDDDDDAEDDGSGFDGDTGYEEASDSQVNSEDDSSIQGEAEGDSEEEGVGPVTVAGQDSLSEEQQKAKSVVKQLGLYEKLFAGRINLQKVVRGSLYLPLPAARQAFLEQEGKASEKFAGCLEEATEAAEGLMQQLLELQKVVLKSNPESKCILKDDSHSSVIDTKKSKHKPLMDDDDEEITSSEDESDEEGNTSKQRRLDNTSSDEDSDDSVSSEATGKRKRDSALDLKELEKTLAKRHCAMRPYRNKIVAFWDERTRLLQSQSKAKNSKADGGAFSAFDEGFGIMVQRLLADREKLLKRTQLRSIARENLTVPVGSKEVVLKQEVDVDLDIPKAPSQSQYERYDPEIYDDTDFYTRYLEEIIKGQHRRGTSGLSTAQFLDITQKLRKKNKKVVDTRRSKGRKLKYDVISSLLQYLPPCGTTSMEEEAVDQVTMSLFGGCHSGQAGTCTTRS